MARLLNGEHYDWHFQIAESNRSKSKFKRHDVVRRYIKNRIRNYNKVYYDFFSECHSNQIRNAIAHSKYALMGRNIHLHNYIEEDPYSQKINLSFDEWTEIFHKSLVMYNEYAKLNHMISRYYQNYIDSNNNSFDIRILTPAGEEKRTLWNTENNGMIGFINIKRNKVRKQLVFLFDFSLEVFSLLSKSIFLPSVISQSFHRRANRIYF
ncbi:MAG: hypothetical protein IPK08_15740 [Bacteroidetes bacterium]|nr:hypothetical protein [Bacteroidota bacterium]